MKNKTLVTLALTLFVPTVASAQARRKPPRPAPVTRTEIVPAPVPPPQQMTAPPTVVLRADLSGRLDGSTYTNNLLGVQVTLPAGWQASDPGVKRQIEEQVKQEASESIQNKPASSRRELQASVARTSPLLLAIKPTDATSNPVMFLMSEDISVVPLITSPKQYAAALVRSSGDDAASQLLFDTQLQSERIGAVEYTVATARPRDKQSAAPGVEQRSYITVRRNHALAFILTFAGEEQRQACLDVIRAVEYR